MLPPRLHPDIERAWGYGRPVLSGQDVEALFKLVCKWVARRANELCTFNGQPGVPQKFALIRACAESGVSFTQEQINAIWEANQKELDDPIRCPIVVTSEREYRDEIDKARKNNYLFQHVRW